MLRVAASLASRQGLFNLAMLPARLLRRSGLLKHRFVFRGQPAAFQSTMSAFSSIPFQWGAKSSTRTRLAMPRSDAAFVSPASRPVFGSIYHGWAAEHLPHEGFRRVTSAPWFVWNERDLEAARARKVPNTQCVGSPFAYLAAMRFPQGIPSGGGDGTLAFPSHSAEQVRSTFDVHSFIAQVEATTPGPYAVSVFYQDLDGPATNAYRTAGWRVFTLGTRANPLFLDGLIDQVLRHTHVTSNMIQTAVWYSAYLRRSVRIVGPEASNARVQGVGPAAELRWPSLYAASFDPHATIAQASFELGVDRRLSPDELREALGWTRWGTRAAATLLATAIAARTRLVSGRSHG